jgi:hypothetical protein
MDVLSQLRKNKGTVSSALSKKLAKKALAGDEITLKEAVKLMTFEKEEREFRAVRSGAAKIVETVAQARPELVVPFLQNIFPALEVGEPQTRWMTIRIFGFCASLDPKNARRAIPFAEKYIQSGDGLCLRSSADLFLGDVGALSTAHAEAVFPILELAASNMVPNERDWLLEAFHKIFRNLNAAQREKARAFAKRFADDPRQATRLRAASILAAEKKG